MATGSDSIGDNWSTSNRAALNNARREDFAATAQTIERDFRRLVETLQDASNIVESSDEELVQQLCSTKSVAERGLRLSKLLSKLARRKRD
jgi:hypothetical protein